MLSLTLLIRGHFCYSLCYLHTRLGRRQQALSVSVVQPVKYLSVSVSVEDSYWTVTGQLQDS